MPAPPGEADLRSLMETVARRLLGEPNKALSTSKILRWGAKGSMVVDVEKGIFYNHEIESGGGVVIFVERQLLLSQHDAWEWLHDEYPGQAPRKTNGHAAPGATHISKAYDYPDADWTLLFQVCRKTPKGFVQRRPDPAAEGGWNWSTKGVKQVPYRLPELITDIAEGREIWIPEGEKDVDRLRTGGLAATCNAGGAGKWRPELNGYFKGAGVTIVADNDQAGRDHAADVARQLAPFARRVRVLDLGRAWPACPPKGDASDFFNAGQTAAELEALADAPPIEGVVVERQSDDIEAVALDPRPINQIPPRRWAYGHFLQFGSAAVMAAPDGIGKGFVTTAMALSVIFGVALLGERIWRTGPVAIITYEDDREEWERRIAAACLYYKLDFEAAIRSIHFIRHRTEARVVFAGRGEEGGPVRFPDSAAIVRELRACGAVLLVVDPFNSAHDLDDGNSNVLIARVAQEITRVAQATGVAALVLHHVRKGSTGEVDDLMGATSLRATFRGARILVRMTEVQAEGLGIKPEDRFRYFRIAGTKENYAPPPEKSHWYRLMSQPLGNDTDDYPDGDDMAVATIWQPPSPFEGVSLPALKRVFDNLREGVRDKKGEWRYSVEVEGRLLGRRSADRRGRRHQSSGQARRRHLGGERRRQLRALADAAAQQVHLHRAQRGQGRRHPGAAAAGDRGGNLTSCP